MATLEDIADKSAATLTDLERDKLREILEFDSTPTSSNYIDLEAKCDALAGPLNQRARAYIDDWDLISAPVELDGGVDALKYETTTHELQIRNRIRLLLGYPKVDSGPGSSGGFRRIPVGYGGDCGSGL